jgi:hypothetical protein
MKRIFISLILALIMLVTVAFPVFAVNTTPTLLSLDGAWAYQDCYEDADMTFLFYYNAYYNSATPYPDAIAAETLIVRLMHGVTEIYRGFPYPYYQNGYQGGVVAMYFTAAEVAAIDAILGHAMWNSDVNATIEPNPLVTWNPSTPPPSPQSITWDTVSTTKKQSQSALGIQVLGLAVLLKQYWGINLVEVKDGVNYVLTTSSISGSGQDYFLNVLPNLKNLAPQILSAQVTPAIYKTIIPPLPYAPDEMPADATVAAGLFGMSKGTLTSLLAMVALLIFSLFISSKAPYLTRYILYIDGVIAVFYTRLGALVPIWATVIGVLSLLLIGYMVFYERSSA